MFSSTMADANAETTDDTTVTTNTDDAANSKRSDDKEAVSQKLEKELGRRPSIAELEIKSIVQDPKVWLKYIC